MTSQPKQHPCLGKVPFETFEAAKRSLTRPRRRLGSVPDGGKLEPYRCPNCRKWHVGHGLRNKR